MVKLTSTLLLLGASSLAVGEDLLSSLANYPQTTTFQALLKANVTTATSLLPSSSRSSNGSYTVFVPSNAAFEKYTARNSGKSITSVPTNDLLSLFRYHVAI